MTSTAWETNGMGNERSQTLPQAPTEGKPTAPCTSAPLLHGWAVKYGFVCKVSGGPRERVYTSIIDLPTFLRTLRRRPAMQRAHLVRRVGRDHLAAHRIRQRPRQRGHSTARRSSGARAADDGGGDGPPDPPRLGVIRRPFRALAPPASSLATLARAHRRRSRPIPIAKISPLVLAKRRRESL